MDASTLDTAAFDSIEAARSEWQANSPPGEGWVPVSLPDVWTSRWPTFDGVVWYRLTWHETSATAPRAIMLEYLNMAGAVYLNGSLLRRDTRLVEPLTRAWNSPRYWVIDTPLLHSGTNTLLIRVSGLSAYQPGLGAVFRGDPAVIHARFEHARWLRRDVQLFSLAITVTLGGFFLTLWLIRRQESAYGWFSAMSLAWWCFAFNEVATTTWPFTTTDGWERATSIAFMVYCGSFTMFVLRFCKQRAPRIEFALWAMFALGTLSLFVTPESGVSTVRGIWALIPGLTFLASCLFLLLHAWRRREIEQRIMSLCMITFMAAGVHDFLVFFGVLNSNVYFSAPTSQVLMVSMALVLAQRFADNARRVSRFNDELSANIERAKQELALTLHRQHELEVTNARLGERLDLARDLHDGLGGVLVSSIAALEHSEQSVPPERFLSILKELRDDLRIVIDTASTHEHGAASLADQIVPLRHRMTRLFESRQIDCQWQLEGIEHQMLPPAQTLDLMRILQETLVNVLKHSAASWVRIALRSDGATLALDVIDNGIGFDVDSPRPGTGLRSMQNRAMRLGGRLSVSREAATTLVSMRMRIPIPTQTQTQAQQHELAALPHANE
ncbi:MAG TPA: 7TM diverse intracellular signaling domain-containing protein [Pararobbsia sp.]|nr:7TM diverse intracellular signaling domain-containing protein [Pararobbsia sp.]